MKKDIINSTIANNIQSLLERQSKTQLDLADFMGVSQATVSNWCKGIKLPRMDKIDRICDFFSVSRATLMDDPSVNNSSNQPWVSIPIVGSVVAGIPSDAYEDILGYEEISPRLAKTGDFVCLKIKGTSMTPVLQEDDIVVVKLQPDIDSGDLAVVILNDSESTIKQVQKSEAGITLIAYNPSVYPPHFYSNDDIDKKPVKIVGKVVEMHRKF